MFLTYVDESYPKERYLIAGLLVPDREANSLTNALDEVVRNASMSFGGTAPTAELHGYDLVAGKGDWAGLASKVRARIGVYNQALQAADLVAYLARRQATHVESDPRAARANAVLWARIEGRVVHEHCWYP